MSETHSNRWRVSRGRLAGALVANLLATGAAPAENTVVASLALTSDYVQRGLSQSSRNPVLQFGAGLHNSRGYYINGWVTMLDSHNLAPDFGNRGGYEANVVIGIARPLGDDFTWEFSTGRYVTFATSQILGYDYTEFSAALSWREQLRFRAAYAPRATDHARNRAKLRGPRRVLEVAGEWPLTRNIALTGGIGYADLNYVSDVHHAFWSGGVSLRRSRFVVNLAVIGTDDNARDRFFDGRADTRAVLSVIAVFGGGQ